MSNVIKPTIYLIKGDVTDPADIFKDKEADKLTKTEVDGVQFYHKPSKFNPPKWLGFVLGNFSGIEPKEFTNAAAYGAIVLKSGGRFFVVPLGMGSHLLNPLKIEYNFGLKVAINCIPKTELRQLDLTTPETSSQKTKKQAVKSSTTEEFGVNKQKDILRGVVGKLPKALELGDRVEGKDSVRITKSIETAKELNDLCGKLFTLSQAVTYKENYPWIDNMAIITDPVMIADLYSDLISAIKAKQFDAMYISTPAFVDDFFEYEGYVFSGNGKHLKAKTAYPFPAMEDVIKDLGDDFLKSLDKNVLSKSCKVYLRDAEGELDFGWPLNRCIVWETIKNGNKYILSEGHWYKIDAAFYKDVCDFFDMHVVDLELPEMLPIQSAEADYNAHVRDSLDKHYLFDLGHADAKNKHICADKNEICDVFDANKKRFIHLKIGKTSPDITYLLRQGVFSAHILKKDIVELDKFKQYLVTDGCPANTILSPYSPTDYTIVFGCILGKTQKTDIPFFSKVSFRDAVELNLEMMGYKCQFGYVFKKEADDAKEDILAEAA